MAPSDYDIHPIHRFRLFLTVFVITVLVLIAVIFLIIQNNPYTALNPFPPTYPAPVIAAELVGVAVQKTLTAFPYTPTPTTTPNPPTPTTTHHIPTATGTALQLTPTTTKTPDSRWIAVNKKTDLDQPDAIFRTVTPTSVTGYLYPFILVHEPYMKESPYNDNVSNPLLNCNWVGVAGQVFDIFEQPLEGVYIRLSGSIDGIEIKQQTMQSGDANLLGEAGFEFFIADKPYTSQYALWLQIVDEYGEPLSAKAHFNTSVHCTQNLIQIDFIKVK